MHLVVSRTVSVYTYTCTYIYNCPIRCCNLSLKLETGHQRDGRERQLTKGQVDNLQALRTVSSLMTISVVSALGLETLAAIAAASVSRMILSYQFLSRNDIISEKRRRRTHHQRSHQQPTRPNPILPIHSSFPPDPSVGAIQHHGTPLRFVITWFHSMSRVDRRLWMLDRLMCGLR